MAKGGDNGTAPGDGGARRRPVAELARYTRAMPARPITILLTGFGAFPGAPVNPSAAILASLGGAATLRLARLGVIPKASC